MGAKVLDNYNNIQYPEMRYIPDNWYKGLNVEDDIEVIFFLVEDFVVEIHNDGNMMGCEDMTDTDINIKYRNVVDITKLVSIIIAKEK